MAPPPEYDKEPKAPDKNATTIPNEDTKTLNSMNDQQSKSDHKPTSTAAITDGEKSKAEDSVENLDDGRLRALLDEAITYKCPKDREGKSDLFKNLLEEAEQDDQASEAAARGGGGGSGAGGCARARRGLGRRALAHSNSLQDLVAAALAAEPAPRRPRPHAPVSARATHGGSLPSGVDTSFLLGEEPAPGRGGYLATVRCVNPPPLAERRVSASDANCPAEVELLHRRSKPVFPITYTARATLEIGSGSVSSGRAVTTTTPSNQVRTRPPRPTTGPPHRIYQGHSPLYDPNHQQTKLMNALCPKTKPGDLRGPKSDYESFGTPWTEIAARYPPKSVTLDKITTIPTDPDKKEEIPNTCVSPMKNKQATEETCNASFEEKFNVSQTTRTFANKTVKARPKREKCSSKTEKPNPKTETPRPKTRKPNPKTDITKPKTEKPNSKTEKPSPNTETFNPRTETPKPKTEKPNPKTDITKPKTEKPNPKTEKLSPNTETFNPRTETPKPKTEKPNPKTEKPSPNTETFNPKTETPRPKTETPILKTEKSNPKTVIFSPKTKKPSPSTEKDNIVTLQTAKTSKNLTSNRNSPSYNKKIQTTSPTEPSIASKIITLPACTAPSLETKVTEPCNPNKASAEGQPAREKSLDSSSKNKLKATTSQTTKISSPAPAKSTPIPRPQKDRQPEIWMKGVEKWYEDLPSCVTNLQNMKGNPFRPKLYKVKSEEKTELRHDSMQEKSETYINQDPLLKNRYNTKNTDSPIIGALRTDREQTLEKPLSNIISNDENEEFKDALILQDQDNYNISDTEESDIILRKKYRKMVGRSLAAPATSLINPKNVRPMSIGFVPTPENKITVKPTKNKCNVKSLDSKTVKNISIVSKINEQLVKLKTEKCDMPKDSSASEAIYDISECYDRSKVVEMVDFTNYKSVTNDEKKVEVSDCTPHETSTKESNDTFRNLDTNEEIRHDKELMDISQCDTKVINKDSSPPDNENFKPLLQVFKKESNKEIFEETELKDITVNRTCDTYEASFEQYYCKQQNFLKLLKESTESVTEDVKQAPSFSNDIIGQEDNFESTTNTTETIEASISEEKIRAVESTSNNIVIRLNKKPEDKVSSDQYILAELPNNAYVFLTMPERLFTHNKDKSVIIREIPNDVSASVEVKSNNVVPKHSKKKKDKAVGVADAKKKENLTKSALKVLLFENLKRDSNKAEAASEAYKEGDSAVPFSCITTPEVVSSCNTTTSTSQSAVAVDPKPRSVISSSFNGLTLSRPNYGATAAADEYKKSLDENGNAVQGFSSPISGSSQHKKPRRKKSSKNETVIKSHQIDGYQGNKDLNEVLRFIESNAEHGRGAKLGRAKHKDDADDKAGKKRSSERRKDKETKLKRASSLEERSRTTLEELTDAAPPRRADRPRPDAKAERRSWGDDARDAFYYAPEPQPEREPDAPPEPQPEAPPEPPPALELTDFQTVTKRRKPRKRADEPEREPPRRARPPSPRARRESAPPSDRSNDSNDDLDSVHSLPPPPPPAPHASYADIARTRHNIPDLIESCNFYAEGDPAAARPPAPAPDADGYPALGGAPRLPRGKAPPRRDRKERAPPPAAGECPAPDVVGDRRPAVILLDSAARPRDMDGVTFGFDINEQLLGAGGRRPRCDLVRDALAAGAGAAAGASPGGGALAVAGACRPLRYVPPQPPPDTHHLHQIIDYVANAWEDVVRCCGGKVRYFSE